MSNHSSANLSVRGCDIALMRGGAGRPLVILHGAHDGGIWFPFIADLATRWEVLAPVHPGYGASNTPDWLDTIADLARFYLDMLDQLDLSDVDLVGCDLGGWIAAELAARNTRRLASLTLVGASGIYVKGVARLDPFLHTDEQNMRDLFHDPSRGSELRQQLSQKDMEDVLLKNHTTTAKLTWQPRGYDPHLHKWMHRIDVPTLVVWGANDQFLPKDYAFAYQRLIPNAKAAIIPDCGHLPHVEQPQAFVAALQNFLDGMRVAV